MSTNSLYPGTTNGVCVTSIIKDKIREYMMSDSSQQVIKSPVEISICEIEKDKIDSVIHENKNINKQDPVSTTDLVLPSSLAVSMHNSTEPCPHKQDIVTSVRRIGNSLDALLQESKKASRTKPVKKSSLTNQQNADRLFISSDQIRSRKSVSLHDICEEYIQFITVNSSVSGDEEAISTTSENETEIGIKSEEIELEIIPVSAASIRNSQISVITINENSPRKPMNSVIIQSVEEMHVAVENECEKSNGESESNVVVDKLAAANEVVEKDVADTEIFANLNGVKTPVDAVAITATATILEEHAQNIASVIKKQDAENNVDQKKEQHDDVDDIANANVADVVESVEEKPAVVANGVSYNTNDDIDEEDVPDEDDVVDEPLPSSQPAADAKEQPISPPVLEKLPEPEPEVEETQPETKDSQPETVISDQKEPSTVEPESPAVSEIVEKMETDAEEVVEQNSPIVEDEKPDEDDKMETDEVKSVSSPETVPTNVAEESLSPPAAVEKVPEPVTEPKDSSSEEKSCVPVVAEKPSPAVEVAEVTENVDKMDTAPVAVDVKPVIKTVDEQIQSIVDEPKPEPVPAIEIKPMASLIKEKTPEPKTKPIEEPVPETKIEKKPIEVPEKEPVTKETASVKRKAADTGEEPEPDRDGGISSSSSQSSGSEADNTQDCKRIRFDESIFEEDERERLIREFVERSTETSDEIGKNCDKLQHEIAALSDLARAKELEWNSIMRLLKLKEEMLERILFKKRHLDCQSKPEMDANLNKMYKNFVTSSTTSTEQKSNRSETCTPTNINNHVTVVPISSSMASATTTASASTSSGGAIAGAGNGSVSSATASQDLYSTGGKSSSAINSTLMSESLGGKLRPQHRPILPKPAVSSATQAAAAQSSSHLSNALHAVQQAAAAQQLMQPSHSSSSQQQQQQQQHMQQQAQSNMMTSNAAAAAAALLAEQNSIIGEGRQGPILDVKSIIADFRSKNPDALPRRGRRSLTFGGRGISDTGLGPRFLGNTSLLSMANIALGSGSHIRTSVSSTTHNDHRPNSFMMGQDNSVPTSLTRTEMQMRHPAIDSLMLSVNQAAAAAAAAAASGNSSQPNSSTNSSGSNNSNNEYFRETLVKFAKMSEKRGDMSNAAGLHMGGNNKGGGGSHLPPPPPYPEVTLHPVLVPQSSGSPPVQNSLLHGILTKSNAAAAAAAAQAANNQHHPSSTVGNAGSLGGASVSSIQHRPTTFSPTLARLLTAPERNRGHRTNMGSSGRSTKSTLNEILNSKKTRTEVTITPVTTSTVCTTKNGSDVVLVDDDDESEAADRLVIDEGREVVAESASNVIPADQVPECQGCHKKAAQFVCAGCGNQWYCSRECQVEAWENHSEMCSG